MKMCEGDEDVLEGESVHGIITNNGLGTSLSRSAVIGVWALDCWGAVIVGNEGEGRVSVDMCK